MWVQLTPGQILQLIGPGITALFALSFLGMWSYKRNLRYLLPLAAAFFAYTLGIAWQILHLPTDWKDSAIISASFYTLSMLALGDGVLQRLGSRLNRGFSIGLFVCVLTGIYYFSYGTPDLVARIWLLNFGAGLTMLYTAGKSFRRGNSRVDHGLAIALFLFGMSFFVRTALTLPRLPLEHPERFGSSSYWVALQVSIALSGAMLGIILLAAAMFDVIDGLAAEHNLDPATGVLRRDAFEQRVERQIIVSQFHPAALIVFDLDHFKSINDRYGHPVGDIVLRRFGRIILDSIRSTDLAGRYGGEEFVVMLHDACPEIALSVAERIRTTLEAAQFDETSPPLKVTVSAGVAWHHLGDGFPALFARADRLLYEAKHAGRNRVCMVSDK